MTELNEPNYKRNDSELEAFLFFCMSVAGKNAQIMVRKVTDFLNEYDPNEEPLLAIGILMEEGMLEKALRKHRMGKYDVTGQFLRAWFRAGLDLRTCTIQELEELPGIGPKTARFFVSFSRPNQNVAILDRHVLAYMRENGIETPKSTPTTQKKYLELEKKYLELARTKGEAPCSLDFKVWSQRRRKVK